MYNNFFFSPLEQFEILPVFSFYLGGLDFSITNETIILVVIFFLNKTFVYSLSILTLKLIEFFFRLFSKSEIRLFFEYNLKTCHVPKERTVNIKNIKSISNDLILNKTVY